MTYRADYRSIARAALAAVPRFSAVTILESWAGTIDVASLPVLGVVTPSETVAPGSSGQFERGTLLQIVLKRPGSETLEDEMDQDAEAIEAAVFAAIYTPSTQCFPTEISFNVNGDGRERIGTVLVTFRITSWRSAP